MITPIRLRHLVAALLIAGLQPVEARAADIELLNVSYDPTRELYKEVKVVPSVPGKFGIAVEIFKGK